MMSTPAKHAAADVMVMDLDVPANLQRWGAAAGEAIDARLQQAQSRMQAHRVSQRLLEQRTCAFEEILLRVAPHWLEEVAHFAKGAGVDPQKLIELNCLPRDLSSCGGGCTSFIQIGAHHNRLMKIRDEANHTQFALTRTSRGRWFHAAADLGSMGWAHGLSTAGISGGNNTGSPCRGVGDEPGLTDSHALRLVLEKAERIDDIPRIIEELLESRALTGANPGRGSILMFCDHARGLVVEYSRDDMTVTWIDQGMFVVANHFLSDKARAWMTGEPEYNSTCRYERMKELLAACDNQPAPADVFRIVRDVKHAPDSLCNDDSQHDWMSISVQLHEIDRQDISRSLNHLCCGHPHHSPFVTVRMDQRETFLPLASGAYYIAADARYRSGASQLDALQAVQQFEAQQSQDDVDAVSAFARAYDWLMR